MRTQWAVLPLHARRPIFGPPGYEINLLYVAALIGLALAGSGPWSVDGCPSRRREWPTS